MELRRRGERDFLITVGGRVLMTSVAHGSEDALADSACAALKRRPHPRILLGGLGMAFTLRAALDALPADAKIVVAEIHPTIVRWCRGPLSVLTAGTLDDARVEIVVDDVAEVIAQEAAESLDGILLDLYEGPHAATQSTEDPLYGGKAIARAKHALRGGGVFAVWSEEADAAFERRMKSAGFRVEKVKGGRGGRTHVVYVGRKGDG